MQRQDELLGIYLHLARASAVRRRPLVRDKLLVLAGAMSADMGLAEVAEQCRGKILAQSPRHLLARWPSFMAAMSVDEFQTYVNLLRRKYSPEKAEHMLQSLGLYLGRERDTYDSDQQYAESLLKSVPIVKDPAIQLEPLPAPAKTALPAKLRGLLASPLWLEWGPYGLGLVVLVLLALWSALRNR